MLRGSIRRWLALMLVASLVNRLFKKKQQQHHRARRATA
jgi:hypothetical protein